MPIEPDERQLTEIAAVAGTPDDGPVVMLNLNRYRVHAAYEGEVPGGASPDVSGREAYLRYGVLAAETIARLGGSIAWHTDVRLTAIGDESDVYDEVVAVFYPSLAAFMALVTDADLLQARPHRVAALERAALICCRPGEPPLG